MAGEPVEAELARFFGYSHDVLVILSADARVLLISPSVEPVLGYTVHEMIGHRLLELVHADDRSGMTDVTRGLQRGEPASGVEARLLHAGGGYVPMRWTVAAGTQGRLYAVGRDRTDEVHSHQMQLRNEMAELRLRMALELHDGILQTLTGATLQIAVARKLVQSNPNAAERVLAELGRSVSAEQQEMRLYVDEVKGQSPAWADETLSATERIAALLDRVGAIWGVTTAFDTHLDGEVPIQVLRTVLRVIQEATVNSARHGSARTVSVSVAVAGLDVTVRVADDGHGFPFVGRYDHDALKERRLGPLSLKYRVEEAGGRLSIESTPHGATVFVRIPLQTEDPA